MGAQLTVIVTCPLAVVSHKGESPISGHYTANTGLLYDAVAV